MVVGWKNIEIYCLFGEIFFYLIVVRLKLIDLGGFRLLVFDKRYMFITVTALLIFV